MNLETKVGIFVILGFFMVALTTAVFGNLDLNSKEGKVIYFRLTDATGIRAGTPIMYRGLKVGEVKEVGMKDNEIISKVVVYNEYEIPDNVTFNVKQSGFVGQKFVEFEIDPKVQAKSPLQNNYIYDGKQNSANLDAVMAKLNDVAGEMTILLKSFNEVITTDTSKNALQDSIANLKDITDSIKNIITTNDKNIQDVIQNAKTMTDMIERIIEKNEKNLNTSINNIAEISATLKAFTASVDQLMVNNQGNIDESLQNLKDITDKVKSTMDDIENIARDINEGKGTLGMLINDEETKKDVKNVVSKVSSFLGDDYNSNEDRMTLYTTIGADYLFDAKSVNTGRGYALAHFYTDPKNFFLLGLSNVPMIAPDSPEYDSNGNKIKNSELAVSLQYSHIFYDIFGLRFGVFDNTLGLGADIYPLRNNNLAISFEAYDFNTYASGLDVYTKAYIRWHFYKGMFIQAGVEDIIGNINRMYMVGAGVRFKPSELSKLANKTEKETNSGYREKKDNENIYDEYNNQKEENSKQSEPSLQNNSNEDNETIILKEDKYDANDKNTDNNTNLDDKEKIKKNDKYFDNLVF